MRRLPWDRLLIIVAFAIALGYSDGVAGTYIRKMCGISPMPEHVASATIAQMPGWLVGLEPTRIAASGLLLVCMSALAGRGAVEMLGIFLIGAGTAGVFRYVSIAALADWPRSLASTDALMLFPRPLHLPVWVVLLVCLAALTCGLLIMARANRSRPAGAAGRRKAKR